MIKKVPFYKILSAIHVVFFTSILCFGTVFVTGTLLMIPALAAAFKIGKAVLYDELDITNSIVLMYFRYLKESLRLERFVPVNLIMILNMAGMWAAAGMENTPFLIICLVMLAMLLTVSLYIAGYDTFVDHQFQLADVGVSMFIKPLSVITVLIVMILCIYFFSGVLATVLIFTGTFFLFVLEVVIFVTMLYYLDWTGRLDEEDKFAYLVLRAKKK